MNAEILEYALQLKQESYPAGKTRGACLEAASHLFEHFYSNGMACSVQFGYYGKPNGTNGHAWFEYWDDTLQSLVVVDITADQFDPNVGIIAGPISELPQYHYEDS